MGGRNNECSVRHFLREAKMRLCFETTTTTTTKHTAETNQSKTRTKKSEDGIFYCLYGRKKVRNNLK